MNDDRKPYLRLHSVDVFVRDQERSVQFYCETLGFQLAFDARLHAGQRWVGVAPPDGTTVLTLIQPAPNSAEYKLIGRATRAIFVTDDVARTFMEWSARGVRFRHTPRLRRIRYERQQAMAAPADATVRHGEQSPIWGEVFTRFEDIDRNSFALVSFDEVSKAVEAQRRAYEQKLEAERRAAHEIAIAREVQARLFPQSMPPCRTLEYAGACRQARQVGGDYYDFLQLGKDRLGLVLADIAGKGMPAALLMANLQANLRSQCATASEQLEAFLRMVNALFFANTGGSSYATMFFGEYDDRENVLRYVNCGHLCGLVMHADGGVDRLDSTSTVVGLFQAWDCSAASFRLADGDVFALYTDGVTEAFNESGEDFGEERLIESLRRHAHLSPPEMTAAVVADVERFSGPEQQDDITVILAKRR